MKYPPFMKFKSESECRKYYINIYCQKPIYTSDKIPVYFSKDRFKHAFYESKNRDGIKDTFSVIRAKRMKWIKATLTNPKSMLFKGWDRIKKAYDLKRRVAIVFGDFVVIISLTYTKKKKIKGKFISCFLADNSINKILASPRWTIKDFINENKK